MRLFDVGETIATGCRLQKKRVKDKDHLYLPLGSPKSSRYLSLRVGKSLLDDSQEILKQAHLTRDRFGVFCLTQQKVEDEIALVRACIASTPGIPVTYEFGMGSMVAMSGVFNTDPPVPMYLIEMAKGASFRWQRGHDGVVYLWDGTTLHERRGIELPS